MNFVPNYGRLFVKMVLIISLPVFVPLVNRTSPSRDGVRFPPPESRSAL